MRFPWVAQAEITCVQKPAFQTHYRIPQRQSISLNPKPIYFAWRGKYLLISCRQSLIAGASHWLSERASQNRTFIFYFVVTILTYTHGWMRNLIPCVDSFFFLRVPVGIFHSTRSLSIIALAPRRWQKDSENSLSKVDVFSLTRKSSERITCSRDGSPMHAVLPPFILCHLPQSLRYSTGIRLCSLGGWEEA